MSELYDYKYYNKHTQGSYKSAITILSYLKKFFNPTSIIDFGCGTGAWLKASKELFDCESLGIDQHIYNSVNMLIQQTDYLNFDIRNELNLERKFDLAISVEVAEHIEFEYSKIFIKNLCVHSDIILFSAALPRQGGTNHINEQPCSFWVNIFLQNHFRVLDCIRPYVWNNEDVEIWYRNNCLLFIAEHKYKSVINKFSYCEYPLDIIHPQMLERIMKRKD